MDFTPPFGPWLRQQRARLDLTQGDLARWLGYSAITIRKIEAGDLKPSKQLVDLLADHLGVPAAQRDAFLAFATDTRTTKPGTSPNNLPTPPTTLIGRAKDVAAMAKLLRRQETRLITLVGPPGVGKTRLSIQVARESGDAFRDGVWFVPLADVSDPQAAIQAMLRTLEVEAGPGLSASEALTRHLRGRELLLVLDNLEQVLDVAPRLAELLAANTRLKMIVTSREPLRIAGEFRHTVSPLGVEGDGAPAVTLFMQRAQAIRPDFELTAETEPVVRLICRKLDGLPLSIELAAARMESFTPRELLAQLDRRLHALQSGARDVPARQRSLRATIDWSYSLLNPAEQALFRRLGTFVGGFTMHAAQTISDIDGVLHPPAEDVLTALAAKGLLVREDQPDETSRYRMLETIREYALDKLTESDELNTWQRHHAEYFAAIGVAAERSLPAESGNWRAAFAWTQLHREMAGLGLLLASSGVQFIDTHGRQLDLLIACQEQALANAAAHRFPEASLNARLNLGVAQIDASQLMRAHATFETCREMHHEYGDDWLKDTLLWGLGTTARELGRIEDARRCFSELIELSRQGSSWLSVSLAPISLGEVEVDAENPECAEALLNEGLALARAEGAVFLEGWALNHLAHAALLRQDPVSAIDLAQRSIDRFLVSDVNQTPNIRIAVGWSWQALGEIGLANHDAGQARRWFDEALQTGFDLGVRLLMAWCLAGLAGAAALDEEAQRGAVLWGAGEALRQEIGCRIASASRKNRERTVAVLQAQLGGAEFARLAAEGAKMTLDEAVNFALG